MQSRLHTVWRALIAAALALAGWAPVILAVLYGGSYLKSCYDVLTAPGVPIEYRYESEAGTMLVRADSYWIIPGSKQGSVSYVRVFAPDGSVVASADKIDFFVNGDVPTISFSNLVTSVHRNADGTFDLAKMVPIVDEEEEAEGVFRLVTNRATVNYSDENVPGKSTAVRFRRLQADGADGVVMFRTLLDGDELQGQLGGSVMSDGSLKIEFESDSSEFAGLLGYFDPVLPEEFLGEFAHVSAESLTLDGSIEVWSPADRPMRVTGDVVINGRSVVTPDTFRNAEMQMHLVSDGTDVALGATFEQRGLAAVFDGRLRIADPFWIEGDLQMDVAEHATLPPQVAPFIDPVAVFSGASFDGWFETDGEKYLLDGETYLQEVSYGDDTATGVKGRARLDNFELTAQIEEAEWSEVGFSGAIGIDLVDGSLSGHLKSKRGRLEPIAERFGTDRLEGVVSISTVLTGTTENPVAEVFATGSGGLQVVEGPLMSIGVFEVRGRVDREGAHLDRMTMSGQNGVVAAAGSMSWEERGLSFKLSAGGIDISAFNSDFGGLGFIEADVSGTVGEPRVTGRTELYGVQFFDRGVPQVVSDWSADGDQIMFENIAARAGTGQIDGSASMRWDDYGLAGVFSGSGVRLEEWLTKETVGSVTVEDGIIAGTLQEPEIDAVLTTQVVYASGVKLDSARVPVKVTKDAVESKGFQVKVGEGAVEGSADYRASESFIGALFVEFPLDRILLSEQLLVLDGTTSGRFNLTYSDGTFTGGQLSADLLDVEANNTLLGHGTVSASVNDGTILADAQIGTLERYVLLSGSTFDLETRDFGGDIVAYNFPVEDLASMAKRPTESWPKSLTALLDVVTGSVGADITLSGKPSDPDIDVRVLELSELVLRGRKAGTLSANGSRSEGKWQVTNIDWNDMATVEDEQKEFSASGQIDEVGSFDLTAGLYNFDASWLNTLFPEVPLLAGTVRELKVERATGTFDDPTGTVTFDVENLDFYDGTEVVNLRAKIDNGRIDVADRLIDLSGDLAFLGLEAKLGGFVPFSSLVEPEDGDRQPMNVQVTLNEGTQFSAFAPYLSGYDEERTSGSVTGSAWIAGLLGDFSVGGDLHLQGDSFAVKGQQQTALKDIDLFLTLSDWTTTVSGSVGSSLGGTAKIDLDDSPLVAISPDLLTGDVTLKEFLERTALSGKIALDQFKAAFTLPESRKESSAVVSTDSLAVGGTLSAPRFSGLIDLTDVYVRLPDEIKESPQTTYSINPVFEQLSVRAAQGSRLDSGTAQIDFFGTGRIGGSLQNPDVSFPLSVAGGVFQLPTARVTLETGGSITVGYSSQFGAAPSASAILNLQGRTRVSARRLNNEYESYEVQLNISGNLLVDGGLTIEASSDPPDLTSDQIMAILGRKDLIEGFAQGGEGPGLRDTLFSAALPTAANLLTSDLARELGLDYISLDYNPFDQAVAGLGKTLGHGVAFHARRQLSTPTVGRLKYELQFTYRLPLRESFFSRLRLSFGMDQDVPWRVGLNWARRF